MRLAKLSEYRSIRYTAASAPKLSTLRKKIDAGKIPGGQKIDGRYFVDLDVLGDQDRLHQQLVAGERAAAANPLLRGLL